MVQYSCQGITVLKGNRMIIAGFTDEVSDDLSLQIKALKELGWSNIDLRTVNGKNISSLSDYEFDKVHRQLAENNIEISCFGSTVANWGRDAITSFDQDMLDMKNSIQHMKKANVRFIRIMSYKLDAPVPLGSEYEKIVIKNIKHIVRLAEENDIVCLHENCDTWAGQSCCHSLRLLEEVNSASLKLVFDTGNPVGMHYIKDSEPYTYQNSLKFFQEVFTHVEYLHIKDARRIGESLHYTFPGEGMGNVPEILQLIGDKKMDIPVSIEPHVAVVFHDPTVTASFEERRDNFIAYGKRLEEMAGEAGLIFSK